MEETAGGRRPSGQGWFVVNVRDAEWETTPDFGAGCAFEKQSSEFPQFGINITTLDPGQPNGFYHRENQQEAFLVLSGECRLIVEGEERTMKAWDFFHCPPGTDHILVGAGTGPAVILMAGARLEDEQILYPVSEAAAKHRASAERETTEPREAYAQFERPTPGRPAYWDLLPWAQR
jgi:uncharacterized cupin superfamily protein